MQAPRLDQRTRLGRRRSLNQIVGETRERDPREKNIQGGPRTQALGRAGARRRERGANRPAKSKRYGPAIPKVTR